MRNDATNFSVRRRKANPSIPYSQDDECSNFKYAMGPQWITFSHTITKIEYVVRFTERWGAVVVLSFSNAYNSVRTHESMHLVGCYLLIGFHWQSKIRKGA